MLPNGSGIRRLWFNGTGNRAYSLYTLARHLIICVSSNKHAEYKSLYILTQGVDRMCDLPNLICADSISI